MYIRLKFFSKKEHNKFNEPFYVLEVEGKSDKSSIKILILKLVKKFYGEELADKIKSVLEND